MLKQFSIFLCILNLRSNKENGTKSPVNALLSAAFSYDGFSNFRRFNWPRPREPFTYAPNAQIALQQAQAEGKPILDFVHWTNCIACENLCNDLSRSEGIKQLSEYFVIMHSLDGSDRQLENLGTAKYYPRFYFLDSSGSIIRGISNRSQTRYPHYYSTANELIISMLDVLNGGQY